MRNLIRCFIICLNNLLCGGGWIFQQKLKLSRKLMVLNRHIDKLESRMKDVENKD